MKKIFMIALVSLMAISCGKKECERYQTEVVSALSTYQNAKTVAHFEPTQGNKNKEALALQNYEQKLQTSKQKCDKCKTCK